MDIHYNAFISYRHHPEDIRVASEIHRLLERFRVPRGLRGKTREIKRLFRDKEELPITSNLTEDITAALRNSDYLIVICSVHTRESIWVQREIETFLQTHERSQVLTVLCSGEPYEVIPEILLYEDVTDPVTGETIRRDVEPLSCDWRLPGKQARREELPRLAAALMGCGYDDLRQRQRHYRMQRLITAMAAAAALSLGFAGYFLYTSITIQRANVQIQANLEEALRNQSLFLTNAAREQLDGGDRLSAIALAMEALPEYPGERPYVPDAEYMLSDALGLYEQEQIVAVGAMGRMENILLSEFWVSDYQDVAVIRDARGVLSTWNTETMEKIAVLPVTDIAIEDLVITETGLVVFRTDNIDSVAYAMTLEGEMIWQKDNCWDMEVLTDNTAILLLREGMEEVVLQFVDLESGAELLPQVYVGMPDSDMRPSEILSGGSKIGDTVVLRYWGFSEKNISVVDPESQVREVVLEEVPDYFASLALEDGRLLLMCPRESDGMTGIIMGSRQNSILEYDIICYDLGTGNILWNAEMVTYSYSGNLWIEQIPDSEKVLCISGDVIQVLDLNTGMQISRCEAGNNIMDVDVGTEDMLFILQDGYYGAYYYEENRCGEYPYMENNLIHARLKLGDGLYGLQRDSDRLTVYRLVGGSRLWETSVGENEYALDERFRGQYLAYSVNDRIYLFDTTRQEILMEWETGYVTPLEISEDGSRVWAVTSGMELITCYAADGHVTAEEFPEEWNGKRYFASYDNEFLYKECLYYFGYDYVVAALFCWDLNTKEHRAIPLPAEMFPQTNDMSETKLLGCTDGVVWLCVKDQQVYAVDLQMGTAQLVLQGTAEKTTLICAEGTRAVISMGSKLYGFDGMDVMFEISLDGIRGISAFSWKENLFVLCDNARVYRFDASGKQLGELEVDVYNTFASNAKDVDPYIRSWYVTRDNKLIVNAMGVATVIDCDNWGVCAGIPYFVGYDSEENVMILESKGYFAGCPLYSTEELLEIAREQLNGYALSEEERRYYGIE